MLHLLSSLSDMDFFPCWTVPDVLRAPDEKGERKAFSYSLLLFLIAFAGYSIVENLSKWFSTRRKIVFMTGLLSARSEPGEAPTVRP